MIKGVVPVSFVDWPDKICSVVFTSGCDFMCSWCHNKVLVDKHLVDEIPSLSPEYVMSIIKNRMKLIDGVCFSGGEPLIHGDNLFAVVKMIKSETGLPVKLDTNGNNPDELEKWLDSGIIDFVAMDIKNIPEKYQKTVGVNVDVDRIKRSIEIIKSKAKGYQFRTTKVPGLVTKDDIRTIEKIYDLKIDVQEYRKHVSF